MFKNAQQNESFDHYDNPGVRLIEKNDHTCGPKLITFE